MSTNKAKKFIAGAICPQCHLMDKIVVYTENGVKIAECVRCGHIQHGSEDSNKSVKINSSKKDRKVIWLKPKPNDMRENNDRN